MTDLGRRMKEGSFEEGDEVGPSPGFLTSARALRRAPVNPSATQPRPAWKPFPAAVFLARAVPDFRSLRSILQEEGKKPSSGSSLAHVAEKDSFYCHESLCQLASPDRQPGQTCFLFPFRPILKEIFPHKTYNWCSSS